MAVAGIHKSSRVNAAQHTGFEEGGAIGCGLRPWEAVFFPHCRVAVPWVTAENLIGALSRQRHRGMGLDLPAEQQQRCIDIRHTGQIARIHRRIQRRDQLRGVQRDPMVAGMEKLIHFADIGGIRTGLKFCGMKILPVIPVSHREGLQLPAVGCKIGIRNGRDQAGVQPAGQKCGNRHIGHQLPLDGIRYKLAHPAGCGGKIIGMLMILKPPVGMQCQSSRVGLIDGILPGQKLLHPAEHAAAGCAAGAEQQHLRQTGGIHPRWHGRVGQQSFDFAAEDQALLRQGIEQRLDTAAIPRQKQPARVHLPDRKRKNTIAHCRAAFTPFRKSMEQHLGVGVPNKAVAAVQQRSPQLRRVVQLTVIDQHIGFPLPVQLHGLQAVLKIHDRQPCMDQRRPAADEHATLVRAAARQRLLHGAVGRIPALYRPGVAPDLPRNSAHKKAPFA